MSFFVYDITFLILFTLGVVWFLWKNKKRVEREGILYVYRTKIGLKVLDSIGKKYRKTLTVLSYFIVIVGYILMIFFTYYLMKIAYYYIIYPQLMKVFDGPPLMLLIPYFPQIFGVEEFFPIFYFTYFLIAIAIVAIVHEGAHGIYMRFHNIKVKSTGFGFLGPILAFFVEQDDKGMTKKPIFSQLTILASGVFANLVTGLIFLGILFLFFTSFYVPQGIMVSGYSTSKIPTANIDEIIFTNETIQIDNSTLVQVQIQNKNYLAEEDFVNLDFEELKDYDLIELYQDQPAIRAGLIGTITKVNDQEIRSVEDFQEEFSKKGVGDSITVQTNNNEEVLIYDIELGSSYEEEGKPVLGISIGPDNPYMVLSVIDNLFKDYGVDYKAKSNPEFMDFIFFLLEWIILINVLVALFNMLPLGIFDGGRFFYLSILAITKNEKLAKKSFGLITIVLLLMIATIMLVWFFRRFIF